MARALVVGGTGPTGPHIVAGLEARGYDVTILHTGRHEVPEVAHLPHLHADVRSAEALGDVLAGREYDLAVVTYGRLRAVAEVLTGRTERFVSVGGVPAYRGFFDPSRYDPPGLPVPVAESAPTSTIDDDNKSYRIARTEDIVFASHPTATHFRYPYLYGPRQLVPREWCVVRRILDGRRQLILPDGGLTLMAFAYVENAARAVLCGVDRPDAAAGRVVNVADEECLSLRQVAEICAATLGAELEIVSMPAELAVPARPLMMQAATTHRVLDLTLLRSLGYRDAVPARMAVARTARWLAQHRPEPGGMEERVLEDPFDYAAEDALITGWQQALASLPEVRFGTPPGYGLHYAGPGASYVRPDTRI